MGGRKMAVLRNVPRCFVRSEQTLRQEIAHLSESKVNVSTAIDVTSFFDGLGKGTRTTEIGLINPNSVKRAEGV